MRHIAMPVSVVMSLALMLIQADAAYNPTILPTFNVTSSPCTAKGDGTTNDTTAWNACLALAAGGTMIVPVKAFLLDPFTIPNFTTIQGAVTGPFNWFQNPGTFVHAPTLLINSHASPFITMGESTNIQDVLFYDPGQVAPTASTPTVEPPEIYLAYNGFEQCGIRRNTFVNAYDAISIGGGLCTVESNNIGSYNYAINVDGPTNPTWLTQNNILPWYDIYAGLAWPQTIDTWVMTNSAGIVVRRADEVFANQNFAIYKNKCVDFEDTQTAIGAYTAGYGIFADQGCDTVTYGFYAKSTNSLGSGFQISNPALIGNGSGTGAAGVAAFATVSGGTETPTMQVIGGWIQPTTFSATNSISIASGTTLKVQGVNGINPVGLLTAPTITASPFTVTNTTGVRVRAFVVGSGISAVGINATQTGLTGGTYILDPGDVITIIYTGTPSWTWFGE